MVVQSMRKAVLLLAGCQGLAMTSMSVLVTTSAIIGHMLAVNKALSTLPVALQQTGMMCAAIPAALLMARIGRRGGFWTGAGLGACRGINLASIAEGNFWAANALLGIGWNLLFIGGTTPLTRTHRPEERAKVQALNDFLIFGTSTVSSGALLAGSGWTRYNSRPCHLSPWRSRRSCGCAGTARAQPSYASD